MSDLLLAIEDAAERTEAALIHVATCIAEGPSPARLEAALHSIARALVALDGKRYGRQLTTLMRASKTQNGSGPATGTRT